MMDVSVDGGPARPVQHRSGPRVAGLGTLGLGLLLVGCGDDKAEEYDLESWQSPLAAQFSGTPDPVEGERIYFEEQWSDSSAYAFRCISCHAVDSGDTLEEDADAFTRPAHTTWNAAHRGTWKGSHRWDRKDSDRLGAYGGQICITAYFPNGDEMSPEQAAHLEAWMKTNIDASPGGDPRAQPLDYSFNDWPGQDDVMDAISGGDSGAALGDVDAGEALAARHCGSCHTPEGDDTPLIYSPPATPAADFVARIRKADLGGGVPNDRMPRITHDRLDDDELLDLLAWLTDPGRVD